MPDLPNEGIVQPSAYGETPADSMRMLFERTAMTDFGLAEGAHFGAQFSVVLPLDRNDRGRLLPVLGASARPAHDGAEVRADVLVARVPEKGASWPRLITALGNITLEGQPVGVAMPYARRADYFPKGFRGLGPYETFVVESGRDHVRLLAKTFGKNDWRRLAVDDMSKEGDRPGMFLATQLLAKMNQSPSAVRVYRSVNQVSGRKMLPPGFLNK